MHRRGKHGEPLKGAVLFLVALCALCSLPVAALAAEGSERILDFQSDIRVQPDASLLVRETILVRSAGAQIRHGIYRDFPTHYKDRLGNRYIVDLKVVEVSRDGQPEKFHLQDQNDGERIYFGDENVLLPPGEYTYTLVYTANREIGFFSDHDELYWNVTGTGWLFTIARASATVTLPATIPAASIRVDGYTGPPGAGGKEFTFSSGTGNAVSFECTQLLPPGEGLTIVVSWPKGYLQEPAGNTRIRYFLADNRSTLVGAAGLTLVLLYYVMVGLRAGRFPAKGGITPVYEPPAGVSPAAMRYLVHSGFDDKTFVAAVIAMAVKRFLSIKEKDGAFTLQRVDGNAKPLAPEENAAAAILFPKSHDKKRGNDKEEDAVDDHSQVVLELNNGRLRSAVSAVKKSLHNTEDKIYFVAKQRYMIPGLILSVAVVACMVAAETGDQRFVLGFLSAWLAGWSIAVFFLVRNAARLWKGVRAGGSMAKDLRKAARSATWYALPFTLAELGVLYLLASVTSVWIVLILACLVGINVLFQWRLKTPTQAGREVLDKIDGFRRFLHTAHPDGLNPLIPPDGTPALFDEYLPYAVALDCEEPWSERFSAVLGHAGETPGYAPVWYVGAAVSLVSFRTYAFVNSLSASLSNVIASSGSTPGSSSGSGGGGFSGGGGGGGGGGGW